MRSRNYTIYSEREWGDHYDKETRIFFESISDVLKERFYLKAYLINDNVLANSRRRRTNMCRRVQGGGAMTI